MSALPHSTTDFELLRDENPQLLAQVSSLQQELSQVRTLVEKLTFQLAMLKRMQFGQKSEALSTVMDDLFGTLTELEQPATADTPPRPLLRILRSRH